MNLPGLGIISRESESLLLKGFFFKPYSHKDLWGAGSKSYLRPQIDQVLQDRAAHTRNSLGPFLTRGFGPHVMT